MTENITRWFEVDVQGLVQIDMISEHQKLVEAHICHSDRCPLTFRLQLSASEIVYAVQMAILDITGFLTYMQSLEQLNSPPPFPGSPLQPTAHTEIEAEPQTVKSDFVVLNPNHAQLLSETSGTNATSSQQDIFVFDKY